MQVIYPRCAALDVHKDTLVACVRLQSGNKVQRHLRTFATTTTALIELEDWLLAHGCTHVLMEATGIYWKPVWQILESSFELVLANAAHVKNVPGRKTDVNDATWLADLLAHGLVRGSFVPPADIQAMRDLTRTRKQLVRERTRHIQRIQKHLESANIKLTGLITDLRGKSGRMITEALAGGERDVEKLANMAQGRLKAKRPLLVEALRGQLKDHQRMLMRVHLDQLDGLEKALEEIDKEIGGRPFEREVELLATMPGVGDSTAQVLVAEIGVDMSRFKDTAHLCSWAGLCPRSDQSAGKRRSTRTRKGAPWLKTMLVQAAWAAVRKKDNRFRAQYLRLKARRGSKKAIVAVAAAMLRVAYAILRDGRPYQEVGMDYWEQADKEAAARRLVRRLASMGFEVEFKEAA